MVDDARRAGADRRRGRHLRQARRRRRRSTTTATTTKTAQAWRDGAFTVGDVGRLDADGYLYITDRVSDMVIRDGVNVYPREIEDVLHLHPAVVDCAVFGVADERHGEMLVAVVETRGRRSRRRAWRTMCAPGLADFKCPEQFTFVDELPRDPNGKVLKRLLRESMTAGAERVGQRRPH